MASLIRWVGKKLDDVIPGDQSYLHNGKAAQVAQNVAQAVQNPMAITGAIAQQGGRVVQQAIPRLAQTQGVQQAARVIPFARPVSSFVNTQIVQPALNTDQRVGSLMQGRNTYAPGLKGAGQGLQDAANIASAIPGVGLGVKAAEGAPLAARLGIHTLNGVPQGVATSVGADLEAGKRNAAEIARNAALAGAASGVLNAAPHAVAPTVKAVSREAKAGFPNTLANDQGFIAGPKASGFYDAASNGKTFLGPDNKSRFEVSDAKAKLNVGGIKRLNQGQTETLGNVLDHKDLYTQYPQLAGVKVKSTVGLPQGAKAIYDEGTDTIHVDPSKIRSLDDLKSTLLHENQHAVQATENTARGGLPGPSDPASVNKSVDLKAVESQLQRAQVAKDAENMQFKQVRDAIMGNTRLSKPQRDTQLRALVKEFSNSKASKEVDYFTSRRQTLVNEARRKPANQEAVTRYQNLTGEAEANAVEQRAGMGQNELTQNPVDPFYNKDPRTLINSTRPTVAAKAGASKRAPRTLNTERLNISDEAKGEVNALSAPNEVTKMTDEEVRQLARGAGIDARSRTVEQTRAQVAEQLNLRKEITTLTNEADQLLKDGKLGERASLFKKIQELSRASTEQGTDIARQLSARRILANELDTPMQRIFKLLDKAGVDPDTAATKMAKVDFNDANAVVKAYRELVPPTKQEWLDTIRYNSMLSSPLTQINNVTPNFVSTGVLTPIEKTLTGVLDAAKSLATGTPRKHVAGEGIAYTKGYYGNFSQAKERFTATLTGKLDGNNITGEGHIPLYAHGQNKAHDVLSFPMRLMEAFDQFQTALTEGGLESAMRAKAKAGVDIGSEAVQRNGIQSEAAYRLYRQELGDKSQGKILQALDAPAQAIMGLRNNKNRYVAVPAKFTVPFVRTVVNIFKQGIEYSPAGVLTMHGSQDKTEQLSKAIMGATIAATGGALLGQNRLTWAEPTSQKEKDAFRAAGKQPYSIKIGNNWVSFQKLPPAISFNLALIAGLDDAQKNAKIDQNGVDNVLTALSKQGQFLSGQSYTQSVGNFLKAVQGDKESVQQLASGYPQQLIPGRAFMQWLATATDTQQRRINTDASFAAQQLEALEQIVPGVREGTTTRNDPNGMPIPAQHPIANAVSPAKFSTEDAINANYYDSLKKTSLEKSNNRILKASGKDTGTTKSSSNGDDPVGKAKTRVETATKKLSPGISDDSKKLITQYAYLDDAGKAKFKAQPGNSYKLAVAQYENDKKAGKLNDSEDLKAQSSLRKLKITSDYGEEVNDFYALSKDNMNAMFKQDATKAKDLYDKAKELDAKLVSAGIVKTSKFKYGLESGTTVRKATARAKKAKAASVRAVRLASHTKLLAASKVKTPRSITSSKPKVKKTKVAKSKLDFKAKKVA